MKEKFERFKNEKIAVNVRSQKQYDDFMKMCEEQGLKWWSGVLPTEQNIYNYWEEETCINLNNLSNLSYSDINYYKDNYYKIITYKDFIKEEPKQFTISDLKDNHIVVLRNNTKILYTRDTEDGFKKLIKHDLTHSYGAHLDIMEVWEFDKLVWKREEQILDEVEKKYLSDVIRPFRDRVINIIKIDNGIGIYIAIRIKDEASICLPYLKNKNMYKGMEINKEYTLAELGLED